MLPKAIPNFGGKRKMYSNNNCCSKVVCVTGFITQAHSLTDLDKPNLTATTHHPPQKTKKIRKRKLMQPLYIICVSDSNICYESKEVLSQSRTHSKLHSPKKLV